MLESASALLQGLGVPLWLLGLLGTLLLLYAYSTWTHSTFTRLGFPQSKTLPLLGSVMEMFKDGLSVSDVARRKQFKRKAYGTYLGRVPILCLGDPNDIKRLCIKDFSSAPNHWNLGLRGPLKTSVFDANDERWQNQRQSLSQAFSGLKLKQMTPWVQDCAAQMLENIKQLVEKDGHFEMKTVAGALTMDVIAATGFGVHADSLNNPDTEFVRMANRFMAVTMKSPAILVAMFARFLIPLLERLKFSMIPADITRYYNRVITHAMEERAEQKDLGKRCDVLQLMVNRLQNAKEEDKREDEKGPWVQKGMTMDEIQANGMLMFIAGYDTTASAIAFLAYNLATHPEVQERLIVEIDEKLEGEKPDYDNVIQLTYLDQCVNESLRIYPPATRSDRKLKKAFEVEGKTVPAGTILGITIYAIHHDPLYWPEPDKFDPERFADGSRAAKDDGTFLPFGIGPRMCIASRLALLELKITMATLLQSVRLVTCDKTEIPLPLSKEGLLKPAKGAYLSARVRH